MFGIIAIVLGILAIILGLMVFVGVGAIEEDGKVLAIIGGLVLLVSGIVELLQGIFSKNAAKDTSKIMPAWIFAVIGVATSVISLVYGAVKDITSVFSGIVSVAISILIFFAANTIKKSVE